MQGLEVTQERERVLSALEPLGLRLYRMCPVPLDGEGAAMGALLMLGIGASQPVLELLAERLRVRLPLLPPAPVLRRAAELALGGVGGRGGGSSAVPAVVVRAPFVRGHREVRAAAHQPGP
jgi:hypothetical protein